MRNCWDVYAKSACFCLFGYTAIFALQHSLTPWVSDRTLRWAAAFSFIQILAIVGMALYLFSKRLYSGLEKTLHDQIRPAIQERIMALALEGEVWSPSASTHGPARQVLEQCVAHALASLKESGRDRVARFAVEQNFVRQWEKTARSSRNLEHRKRAVCLLGLVSKVSGVAVVHQTLADNSPEVRTAAARALLVSGKPQIVDQVFRAVLRESLLTRALLASELKRHARYLLSNTIPSILGDVTSPDTLRCLEIVTTWKLAIPALDIAPLLAHHRDRSVLPLVVRLLPYVQVGDSIEEYLVSALDSADVGIQCSAAQAIGQLKLKGLIPALIQSLNRDRDFALASAEALSQMGADGARALERIVNGADRSAAAVALEALEHSTVGTL